MKRYNYKKNLRLFEINGIVFLSLLLILTGKIINTTKVYGQYKEGKKAYAMEDYITSQSIYSKIYNKTKFNCFSKEIKDILKTEEMAFIQDSIVFLEDIKDQFTTESSNKGTTAMLEIHNTFDTRLAAVKESQNKENLTNYNTLVDQYNLQSLFSTEFERAAKRFQEKINQSIEASDFIEKVDFNLYSQVLEKTASDIEETGSIIEEDMKKYYVAKLDWLIKEDNLENLLVETQQIVNDYSNLMEVEWVVDKVTAVTTQKMEESIVDKNYPRYKTLVSRYFTYLSQLPSEFSNRNEIKQLVSNQLDHDYKQIGNYIASNKFEEATQLYDAMGEYIAIVDNHAIDMDQLKQEIDVLWMKNDPIRMFSPLVLTEIDKGKSKWGKDSYVLATDANRDTLYWGEINSQQEIKKLEMDISGYAVHDMYISGDLSSGTPVVIIEETDGNGGTYFNGYRIEENSIVNILNMNADYFEVMKQGTVLIGRDFNSSDISYYELRGGEYTKLFDFGDVKIENTDYYYNPISAPSNAYSYYETEYITASAKIYNGYSSSSLTGSVGISYKDPYGNIIYHDQSSGNYSWEVGINTSSSQQITRGLSSNYNLGMHIVEFWWDGIKIGQTHFNITN